MNAVVLGASTGTGAAITRSLSSSNNHVLGFHRGRHPEDAAKVEVDTFKRALLITLDVGSTYEAVQAGLDVVAANARGGVSVLVHALSGASVGTMISQPAEKVEKTFNLMAHSFLWWVQGLHERRLLAPGAMLLGLSNPVVHHYLNGTGVIGPAKAALEAYIKALAVELGRYNHHVFGIRFGAVQTPALETIVGATSRLRAVHHYISPYRQMMTCKDVARFVEMLAQNPDATWALNGAIIDFDMGSTLTLLDYAFNANR